MTGAVVIKAAGDLVCSVVKSTVAAFDLFILVVASIATAEGLFILVVASIFAAGDMNVYIIASVVAEGNTYGSVVAFTVAEGDTYGSAVAISFSVCIGEVALTLLCTKVFVSIETSCRPTRINMRTDILSIAFKSSLAIVHCQIFLLNSYELNKF